MPGQTQFESGDVLIVADELVVEVFHRSYEHSGRLPSRWLAVRTEAKRGDEVEVRFGRTDDPSQPLYGERIESHNYAIIFRIPAAEEPRLRAFFADVAARAGRTL